MEDTLRELFEISKINHDESEAVIKIALLVMHCNENITNSEVDLINRIIDITKFDKDTKVAQLVATSRLEIMEILHDPEQIKEFIDGCVMKIHTPVIKHSLVKMAEIIANSDNDYSIEEKELINYLSNTINRYH
jgi:hypothetical protein